MTVVVVGDSHSTVISGAPSTKERTLNEAVLMLADAIALAKQVLDTGQVKLEGVRPIGECQPAEDSLAKAIERITELREHVLMLTTRLGLLYEKLQ